MARIDCPLNPALNWMPGGANGGEEPTERPLWMICYVSHLGEFGCPFRLGKLGKRWVRTSLIDLAWNEVEWWVPTSELEGPKS